MPDFGLDLSNITPENAFDIWKTGTVYYCRSNRTGVISSNSSFATLINNAITSVTAGTPIKIVIGEGDFDVAAQILIAKTRIGNISIEGAGSGLTNFIITSAWNGTASGNTAFQIGEFQTIAAGITGTLTANCTVNAGTCTMSTGDSAKFAVDDLVMLTSTLDWSSAPDADSPQAEIKRLTAVNTGTGVLTFDTPALDSYATANTAVVYKMSNFIKNIHVKGITIKKGSGLNDVNGVVYFETRYVDNLSIEDVEMIDPVTNWTGCLHVRSCINSKVDKVLLRMSATQNFNLQYGLVIGNCSQNIAVSNSHSYGKFEHAFETGNSSSANDAKGVARNISFFNCFGDGGAVATFDTHGDGELITFNNCGVLGTSNTGGGNGFQIRSRRSKFVSCIAKNTKTNGYYIAGDADDCELITCIADKSQNDGGFISR